MTAERCQHTDLGSLEDRKKRKIKSRFADKDEMRRVGWVSSKQTARSHYQASSNLLPLHLTAILSPPQLRENSWCRQGEIRPEGGSGVIKKTCPCIGFSESAWCSPSCFPTEELGVYPLRLQGLLMFLNERVHLGSALLLSLGSGHPLQPPYTHMGWSAQPNGLARTFPRDSLWFKPWWLGSKAPLWVQCKDAGRVQMLITPSITRVRCSARRFSTFLTFSSSLS